MSLTVRQPRRYRDPGGIGELYRNDWSGGVNLRDDPSGIDPNELIDAMDMTLTREGSIESRLGLSTWGSAGPADVFQIGYFSELLQRTIWQAGTGMYSQAGSGAFGAAVRTWSTPARIALVDFAGYVYAVHPVDGLYRSTDGTTWTNVASGPVGSTIAVWENKLWIAGANNRLNYSDAGDGGTWSGGSAGTVDIRAVGDAPLTALTPADGGGLLAYKAESAYRVYDSSTGAYQTLDAKVGCANHQAVRTIYGRTYTVNQFGVYSTDGRSIGLRPESERIQPVFTSGYVNVAALGKWCMGRKQDRLYVSLCRAGVTANNLAWEFDPLKRNWMPHTCAMSTYVEYGADDEKLLGGAPSTNGVAYDVYAATGTDNGTAIPARCQLAWEKPTGYSKVRWRQARLVYRGSPETYTRLDHALGAGEYQAIQTVAASVTPGVWGSFSWGDGTLWGPAEFQQDGSIWSLGTGRAMSLELSASTSTSTTRPPTLDVGSGQPCGAWGLYGLHLYYVPGRLA